jgi:hypothetical protein
VRESERERSFIDEQECEREKDHQQLLLQGGRESKQVRGEGGEEEEEKGFRNRETHKGFRVSLVCLLSHTNERE